MPDFLDSRALFCFDDHLFYKNKYCRNIMVTIFSLPYDIYFFRYNFSIQFCHLPYFIQTNIS